MLVPAGRDRGNEHFSKTQTHNKALLKAAICQTKLLVSHGCYPHLTGIFTNSCIDTNIIPTEAIEAPEESAKAAAEIPSPTKRQFRTDILDLRLTGWVDSASTDMAVKLEYKDSAIGTITLRDEFKGNLKEGFGSKFEREEVQGEIRLFLKPGNEIWVHIVLDGPIVKDRVDKEMKLFCKTIDDLRK